MVLNIIREFSNLKLISIHQMDTHSEKYNRMISVMSHGDIINIQYLIIEPDSLCGMEIIDYVKIECMESEDKHSDG
jgi:hypothetical protein